MGAKSDADNIAALFRELSKIEKRAAGLDRADASAVKEARQLKGQFARTLRRRRGILEARFNRDYTTIADRKIAEQIARMEYLARETEWMPGCEGRPRTLISRPKRRLKTSQPQGVSNVPTRGRGSRVSWLIVRLAVSMGLLAYSVHFLRQFADLIAQTPFTP
jgi:hypothetical protein